jgi:hypothetical protein
MAVVSGVLLSAPSAGAAPCNGGSASSNDFNNDGRADLAIGVPNEQVGTQTTAGAVNVLYGCTGVLTVVDDQVWTQDAGAMQDVSETGDRFGASLASGDFEGTPYDDLAIGVPDEDGGTVIDSGGVHVMKGSASGLSDAGNVFWHQNATGVPDTSEVGDNFGAAVTTGDFNGDGRSDLAIGAPGESFGTLVDAGQVTILYGSASGLQTTSPAAQSWYQDTAGVAGTAETGDRFGAALTAADVNGDGKDDLVIGVPGEDVGSAIDAGMIQILFGSATGLTVTGNTSYHQDTTDVEGTAEGGDQMGVALAGGRLNNDSYEDVVVGVPYEDFSNFLVNMGMVQVFYGSSSGLQTSNDLAIHQDIDGVDGVAESGDLFGQSLAVGDFQATGQQDLAVGAPGEEIGAIPSTGAVTVFYTGTSGIDLAQPEQVWHQNVTDVEGASEPSDQFGSALAASDLNGDGKADFAVGVPQEKVGTSAQAGAVNVLYGSASGLTEAADQVWTQNTPDVEGGSESGDRFGDAVA